MNRIDNLITWQYWTKHKPKDRRCCGNCEHYIKVPIDKITIFPTSKMTCELGYFGCDLVPKYDKIVKNVKCGFFNMYCKDFKMKGQIKNKMSKCKNLQNDSLAPKVYKGASTQ